MNKWLKSIQQVIYPSRCVLCGSSGYGDVDLCEACLNSLPNNHRHCSACALPLHSDSDDVYCGQCLQQPPPYDRCIALWRYDSPVDSFVQQLKFGQKLIYARLMGELLAEHLDKFEYNQSPIPDVVVPVPLHPQRQRQRGFNQAVEIARPIAKRFGIPLALQQCHRTKITEPQSSLPAKQRHKNVKGAFQADEELRGKHVAIVDDAMTTGHTINELAKTLRKTGVSRIDVWVCARVSR